MRHNRKESIMSRFSIIKRLPKKLLLGLAVLALALVAAGGATAGKAEASSSTPYTIEVSFEKVTLKNVDDGVFDHTAEVYGFLWASKLSGSQQFRNLGTPNNSADCTTEWFNGLLSKAPCAKKMGDGTFLFFDTPLCVSQNDNHGGTTGCVAPFFKNNNKFRFTVTANDVGVNFGHLLKDSDDASADDHLCSRGGSVTWSSETELASLNRNTSLTSNWGSGECSVVVNVRRV
jgi:hypothetical protein